MKYKLLKAAIESDDQAGAAEAYISLAYRLVEFMRGRDGQPIPCDDLYNEVALFVVGDDDHGEA